MTNFSSTGEAYNAPPDPLAGFKGATSKAGKRRAKEGEVSK